MATAAVQLASTISRSNTGKVPTILVYAATRAQFDTVARTFSDANALCSLFPCDSATEFAAALDDAATFDAAIVSLELGAVEIGAALLELEKAAPHAAQFILSGALPAEFVPAELLRTGADAIPDHNLAALPYVVDNIMRERRTTHLVQRALVDHEQMFGVLVDHIEDALWVCNASADRILYLSPAFSRIWGVDERELYANAHAWLNYIHPADRGSYIKVFSKHAEAGEPFVNEYRIQRPDGGVRVIRDQGYPIHDAQGRVHRFGGIMHDVTEERRIQEEMRLSQRLEAVGQLAAGIAHEINTPAQFIGDNLRFVRDGIATMLELQAQLEAMARGDEPSDRMRVAELLDAADFEFLRADLPVAIEQSLDGIQRVATIVRAMKEFSHPGSDRPEPTDLNETVRSAITVTRNEWKYVANLHEDLEPDLPAVLCHRQAISQVMVNLIVNAAHAIELAGQKEPFPFIVVSTSASDGWARITVRDEGTGISAEIRERIFDQFFTTKEVGKGTGQGLALAWRMVVDGHGGRIECESEVGVGTTFVIHLPIAGPAAAAQGEAR
ncbi:MAG: PAS domain-containing protein [Gammaproteobacteria bacterium]|nr:PAS domain-containing protein [Gammaproteobacteria bacterium]